MNKVLIVLLSLILFACSENIGTEKYQKRREHVVNVHDKIIETKLGDILIGSLAIPYIINDYLIICDYKSFDAQIHLFDKKDFKYLTSCAYRGQGPGEISNIGHLGINDKKREFYVTDHGKQSIFVYKLDSILQNHDYIPDVKLKIKTERFLDQYQFLNDTLSVGRIIVPTGDSGYNELVARFNMETGDIQPMEYTNPEIEKKRAKVAASLEENIYVECYTHHDLLTICTLDGHLMYNVYGPKWDKQKTNKIKFYDDVTFCKDKIVVTSAFGGDNYSNKTLPTAFLIFDKNGEYVKTLETGYQISYFCYDKQLNRIVMNMNDEIQFAYLDLDGII